MLVLWEHREMSVKRLSERLIMIAEKAADLIKEVRA
jgi:hypothetical protein